MFDGTRGADGWLRRDWAGDGWTWGARKAAANTGGIGGLLRLLKLVQLEEQKSGVGRRRYLRRIKGERTELEVATRYTWWTREEGVPLTDAARP